MRCQSHGSDRRTTHVEVSAPQRKADLPWRSFGALERRRLGSPRSPFVALPRETTALAGWHGNTCGVRQTAKTPALPSPAHCRKLAPRSAATKSEASRPSPRPAAATASQVSRASAPRSAPRMQTGPGRLSAIRTTRQTRSSHTVVGLYLRDRAVQPNIRPLPQSELGAVVVPCPCVEIDKHIASFHRVNEQLALERL